MRSDHIWYFVVTGASFHESTCLHANIAIFYRNFDLSITVTTERNKSNFDPVENMQF